MVPAVHAACPAWYRAPTLHPARHTTYGARYGLHAKPCGTRTHPGGARERLSFTEPQDLDSTRARHHKSSSSTGTQYRGAASARGVSTGIIDSRCIGRECVKPPCGLSNKGWISSEPRLEERSDRHSDREPTTTSTNIGSTTAASIAPMDERISQATPTARGLLGARAPCGSRVRSHWKCRSLPSHRDQLAVSAPSLASLIATNDPCNERFVEILDKKDRFGAGMEISSISRVIPQGITFDLYL